MADRCPHETPVIRLSGRVDRMHWRLLKGQDRCPLCGVRERDMCPIPTETAEGLVYEVPLKL